MTINSELSILIIGRILQILIALISIRITTSLLDAGEIGNLYLILTITGFFGLLMINPIGQYINRKTHQWYEEKNLLNVFYIYNYYIILLAILSFFVIHFLYSFGIGKNIELVYLSSFVALFIYMNSWNQTIIPMINMLGNRVSFVILTVVSQIFFLLFAYIFINIFEPKGIFWFLGNIVGFGLIAIVSFIYFIKKIQHDFSLSFAHQMITYHNIKNIIRFALPLSVGVLFLWMQSQSYGIIIDKYIGSEFLGFFGVGMAVALAISSAFESIIMQYLYPQMYKNMNDTSRFSIIMSSILNLIIPIYFLLAIFVSIFAIYLMTILVDVKYYDSYIYTIFGIWIAFFKMSSNMLSNIAHAKLRTKELIYPYAAGGVLAVIGVILAANMDEYKYYIPLALLIAGMFSFIVMYIKMNKLVEIKFELKNIYFVVVYSIPFTSSLYFYNYSYSIVYSTIIVGIFGMYFLYLLYLLIKRGGKIE